MKRNRRNEKMTLLGFVSHGRILWIENIFIFGMRVPPSTFFHDDVSAGAPIKGTILTLTTQTLRIFNSET